MTDPQVVQRATGLLRTFNEVGVLAAADVHVALRLERLGNESSEVVLLAVALAVRAVRLGSVCVDLQRLQEVSVDDALDVDVESLPWPAVEDVVAQLRRSPLVSGGPAGPLRPLHVVWTDEGPLLYLDRYLRQEQVIRRALEQRDRRRPEIDRTVLVNGLDRLFQHDGRPSSAPDRQRVAAALVLTRWTAVMAGGPGTGKTHTVARILALLLDQYGPTLRIALAAPTGKAAARLEEAVKEQSGSLGLPEGLTAMTLHRLLGWQPGSRSRFRHDTSNRLPYDVVVVDETSMVSLTMMARLFEAVRPDARLVLVGDPDQLTSVEAGAVLSDLVARPVRAPEGDHLLDEVVAADLCATDDPDEAALSARERERLRAGVVRLSRGRRFVGAIAQLAVAVREGRADEALTILRSGDPQVSFHAPDDLEAVRGDVVRSGLAVTEAASGGDVSSALDALESHRLLCAHREGPYGVQRWDIQAMAWVGAALGERLDPLAWYPGQPLLVTANDHEARLYNGDTGVIVRLENRLHAAFRRGREPVLRHPSRLSDVQTVYAMTIHRGQGSQYATVSVLLPAEASSLLTRELLYTAITRAREHVRVIGTEESVRAGVERQVLRASGLRRTLRDSAGGISEIMPPR